LIGKLTSANETKLFPSILNLGNGERENSCLPSAIFHKLFLKPLPLCQTRYIIVLSSRLCFTVVFGVRISGRSLFHRFVRRSNLGAVCLSNMSETLRKRGREQGVLPDSTDVREPKRFNGEETDRICHLLQLDKTPAEEEEFAPSEDFVSGVMRSLEEEISATCSTFYAPNSEDNLPASDISSNKSLVSDSGIDLCYLLEASDDDLGIPSSPVLDLKDQVCQSPKEILSAEGFLENSDLKCLGENWHFKDEFENFQQFALYEDPCHASELHDYMNRDLISPDMFFDGGFSAAWPFETAGRP